MPVLHSAVRSGHHLIMPPTETLKKLPRTKGVFLLGDTPDIIRDPLKYIVSKHQEQGDIYQVDTIARKVMVVSDPDIAKYVLQENNKNYIKSYDYELLKIALGQGLLTSEGDFWLRQRRLAAPAFHKKRLELLFDIMVEEGEALKKRWRKYRDEKKEFDLVPEMMNVTVKIVARALFAADVTADVEQVGRCITIMIEYFALRTKNPFLPPLWVPTPFNLQYRRAHKEMDRLIYKIIRTRRENRKKGGELRDDLLEMYMEARDEETGEGMTDVQLRDEIITLFIAGHETSAVSLTWTFIQLSQNPEIRKKAQEEAKRVLNGKTPTLEHIPQLTYTRQIIDESMRLFPPAWVVGRRPLEDDNLGGYHVPKGMNIIISTYLLHRHKDHWENPEKFDPDRFLPENTKGRHRYAYFPFGGGPRLCIGMNFALMEMTLLLAMFLEEFSPDVLEKEIGYEPLVTLRPKGGIRAVISK